MMPVECPNVVIYALSVFTQEPMMTSFSLDEKCGRSRTLIKKSLFARRTSILPQNTTGMFRSRYPSQVGGVLAR
jgi:hypothetical protein